MMAKIAYTEKIAKRLEIGDIVVSSSGKKLKVTHVLLKANRTIVLFDDDMEVDFDPYTRIDKVIPISK
jgi:hypothetical protein